MDKEKSRELYDQLREHGRTIAPTLVLSREARTAHLESPWLSELRDFLCRTGAWRDHPIDSVELFAASPAPGVEPAAGVPNVIGPSEPVFTSVGFGAKGVRQGRVEYESGICAELRLPSICDALICGMNLSDRRAAPPCNALDPTGGRAALGRPAAGACLVLDPPAPGSGDTSQQGPRPAFPHNIAATCYDAFCSFNGCGEHNCTSHKCDINTCGIVSCTDQGCSQNNSIAEGFWASALIANVDHPFVRELMAYFGGDDRRRLEDEILRFVGHNMFARFSNE
jgi:hypothetical protein